MVTGAAALGAAAAGCDRPKELADDLRRWMGHPAAPLLEGPFTPPAGDQLDAISHALNRLTFGPRPGDYARVAALGVPLSSRSSSRRRRSRTTQCERLHAARV